MFLNSKLSDKYATIFCNLIKEVHEKSRYNNRLQAMQQNFIEIPPNKKTNFENAVLNKSNIANEGMGAPGMMEAERAFSWEGYDIIQQNNQQNMNVREGFGRQNDLEMANRKTDSSFRHSEVNMGNKGEVISIDESDEETYQKTTA